MQSGATISVVVSAGKEQVAVPVLIGQTRSEATTTLQAAGLVLGSVTGEPSGQPSGEVIRSNPNSGVSVGKGSQEDIVLSSGPTPSPARSMPCSRTPKASPISIPSRVSACSHVSPPTTTASTSSG